MAKHYLGFDLGHADTAIALLNGETAHAFAAPANLEIQGQTIQPTALTRFAEARDERPIIGGRAIREASKAEGSGGARLRAAFKARPDMLGDEASDIADFFSLCLDEVNFDPVPPEGWAGVDIAVGCPSAWSRGDTIRQYKDILKGGLRGHVQESARVTVVPESRAALLQAIDNPNSPLTTEARQRNILVIDIGSSTLDFSLLAPEAKAAPLLDAGIDLGASFFDRKVLEGALKSEPETASFLQHNPHYRTLWLYYARRTKEQYFIDAPRDDGETISGGPVQAYFSGGKRRDFSIGVTGRDFARYRRAPYDRPLHPSPELLLDEAMLAELSWEEVYKESLRALKAAIARRGADYGQVLLAGGASRMPFTATLAKEIFEQGEDDGTVLRDPEPSHMVSRGLARWGRKRVNIERFSADARALMRSHMPALAEEKFGPLRKRLAAGLAEIIFTRFVLPVVERWKDGAFRTGQDVRREIETLYTEWLSSDEAEQFFVAAINRWWRSDVKHELDRELDRLHTLYGISHDIRLDLSSAIEPDAFSFSTRSIELPFETVIQAAIITLAYAVTIATDAVIGGIPIATGLLTAAVAFGGRWTRSWIAGLDVPAFARRLPDRLPGRDVLFANRVRGRVEKELETSLDKAKAGLLRQVEKAVTSSVERQTSRARALLLGDDNERPKV